MRQWIVFGAGAFGKEVYDRYGFDNIAFFVDNNDVRIGELFCGKEIISFEKFCRIYKDYKIVIAVRKYEEIERQLLERGITDYKVYLFERENITRESQIEKYKEYLFTPTQITKIENIYFIVDCWQHRVIYSDILEKEIIDWDVLDDDLAGPHSIASDGDVYIVDDTDHGEVCVYRKIDGCFIRTQVVYGLGFRPHKCLYYERTNRFYVLLSESCEIAILKNEKHNIEIENIIKIDNIEGYARSIHIIENKFFVCVSNGCICELIEEEGIFSGNIVYKIPEQYAGMNDIEKVGDSYYISVYTDMNGKYVSKVIRTKTLENMQECEDVSEDLHIKGIPYFFSKMDGKIYLTEIDTYSGISSFDYEEGELVNRQEIFSFDFINNVSLARRYGKEPLFDLQRAQSYNVIIGLCENIKGRRDRLLLQGITDVTKYYLYSQRKNVLAWYSFRKNSSALELYPEFGTVTDVLCEKCEKVTVVTRNKRTEELVNRLGQAEKVCTCTDEKMLNERYDYIVAFNPDGDRLIELLRWCKENLSENGRILLAVNNGFGMFYKSEEPVIVPFSQEEVTKSKVKRICQEEGYAKCEFYYPLPNWMNCEVVCSKNFEEEIVLQRLKKACFQQTFWEEIIDEEELCVLSKSFLIEISVSDAYEGKSMLYSLSSTKRKRQYQMNTVFWSNGIVEKKALYQEGWEHIKRMKENEQELGYHGVSVLEGSVMFDSYTTPCQKDITLEQWIYNLGTQNKVKEIKKLLEKLFEEICRSSELIEYQGKMVLKKGYLDMICQNVFFKDGQFVFFDQEWTSDYVEPEFILYRAITMLYYNNSEFGKQIPITTMLNWFAMEDYARYEKYELNFKEYVQGENEILWV